MTLAASNVFGKTITSDDTGRPQGTLVPAATLAYGAWTQILASSRWAGVSGPGHVIEVHFDGVGVINQGKDCLVTIGKDDAGGAAFVDWITDLSASGAQITTEGGSIVYRFPVVVPNGCSLAAKASANNATPGSVRVWIKILAEPSKPWAIRTGTAVRTYGSAGPAMPAGRIGVAVPLATVVGAWTEVGTVVEGEEPWMLELGWGCNDIAVNASANYLDLAVGPPGAERVVVSSARVYSRVDEKWSKYPAGEHCSSVAGEKLWIRGYRISGTLDDNEAAIVYGVIGRYQEATPRTVAGTVTIDGEAAPDGASVTVVAVDADQVAELVGVAAVAGGEFSIDVPDDDRLYLAIYGEGGRAGASLAGVPGVDDFDITIGSASSGEAPALGAVSPDPEAAAGEPGGFPADAAAARETPIVMPISCADGVAFALAVVRYPGARNEAVIYSGSPGADGAAAGAFRGEFAARSWATYDGTTLELHILPEHGWPESGVDPDITIDLDAIGGDGAAHFTTRSI